MMGFSSNDSMIWGSLVLGYLHIQQCYGCYDDFQQIPQDVSFSNIKVDGQVPQMGMQRTTVSYKMVRPVAVPNVL